MANSMVLGTAGHIDHGKTTLVKALTGKNTDNLAEEIRRGITITPGFTFFETGDGRRIGIVDVPGHERFIKNMIAGAVGIDFVMLVVAANDGVKPQTVEHLWILETLGIKDGLVVLTKCGIVDDEVLELACDDVKNTLAGTFLETADIMRVDSLSGFGISELKDRLGGAFLAAKPQNINAPARLHIDRVFTKKGFGAVVTGTLAEGSLSVGDELFLYPEGIAVRARGLQVHEGAVSDIAAPARVAINLSGVKAQLIARGHQLSAMVLVPSEIIDVKLKIFPGAKPVKFWDRLRLYIGTRELFCRVVPLSSGEIPPGSEDFCQLRLEDSLFCKKDDRFVVRTYSPMETIGGGIVVDPSPEKHSRMNDTLLTALSTKETGGTSDVLANYVYDYPGAVLKDMAAYVKLSSEDTLKSLKMVTALNELYYHNDFIDEIREYALETLHSFHSAAPLKKGIPKEELRSRLTKKFAAIKAKSLDALLGAMEDENLIKLSSGLCALKNFEITLSDKQKAIKNEILAALEKGGFSPPPVSEITKERRDYVELLPLLAPDELIFLDKKTVMHVKYYNKAKEALKNHFESMTEITLAHFRDILGVSRKYAQLIIEKFDDEGFTVRINDTRKLR